MQDQPVTLIISDLHVGGGRNDPGDDHVHDRNQLVEFLREQAASLEGKAGKLELFINGDFLEFAQTATQAFSLVSEDCWCTEPESLRKLEVILGGHSEIFEALGRFQLDGNLVTIAAGNHDVDLFWPSVQARLRQVAGQNIRFECGKEWVERHGGLLQIAHGHLGDVANTFRNWQRPFVTAAWGGECLEMCPGTLFMVKFVNQLEAEYPFADNLLPVTKLAGVLLNDDKSGFMSVAWLFGRLMGTTNLTVLGSTGTVDVGEQLVSRFRESPRRAQALIAAMRDRGYAQQASIVPDQLTPDSLADIMLLLMGRISMEDWQALFEMGTSTTLGDDGITLSAIARANFVDGKQKCREDAAARAQSAKASVVVMGHTHQPDELRQGNGMTYYNPGSWTRYMELAPGRKVTLDELRDESKYPYKLNFVRIETTGDGLRSQMNCFDSGGA